MTSTICILAMAPPVPLIGKLVMGLLFVGLGGLLHRTLRGDNLTTRQWRVAAFCSICGSIVLEGLSNQSVTGSLLSSTILLVLVSAASIAVASRYDDSSAVIKTDSGRRNIFNKQRIFLTVACPILGPLISLAFATITIAMSREPIQQHISTLTIMSVLGLIAGATTAAFVAFITR